MITVRELIRMLQKYNPSEPIACMDKNNKALMLNDIKLIEQDDKVIFNSMLVKGTNSNGIPVYFNMLNG